MNFSDTIYLGARSAGEYSLNGTIKNLKIWTRKIPNNLMTGETK
jgi:hypothetical protein